MRQEIIAEANKSIHSMYFNHVGGYWVREGYVDFTCVALSAATASLTHDWVLTSAIAYSERLFKEYREFSGAKGGDTGFRGINFLSIQDLQRHRQEMLYYFWLANQEM